MGFATWRKGTFRKWELPKGKKVYYGHSVVQAAIQTLSTSSNKDGTSESTNFFLLLHANWFGRFWIVLDQGKLSEYSNWKQKLDLHMEPIDLRMASVREARSAERRFCFEVITPNFKRVYQATSEEDMNSWIQSINNALQSAVEGRAFSENRSSTKATPSETSIKKDIGSVFTGKSHSLNHSHSSHHYHHHSSSSSGVPMRRITVGARPQAIRTSSSG